MGSRRFGAVLICLLSALASVAADKITNEAQAKVFLDELDREYVVEANAQMVQRWAYITNVTEANAAAQVQWRSFLFSFAMSAIRFRYSQVAANIDYQKFQRAAWERVNEFDWSNFQDDATRREFQYLNILGTAALSDTDLERVSSFDIECSMHRRDIKDWPSIDRSINSPRKWRRCTRRPRSATSTTPPSAIWPWNPVRRH